MWHKKYFNIKKIIIMIEPQLESKRLTTEHL